jgi:hypothetical protein
MSQFSAHRVSAETGIRVAITTKVSLYVSPTGDDVLNTGTEEGSPFRTPKRAMQWLSDKQITDSGFVTVNFAGGIYDLEEPIEMNHDQGNRVAFVGARPEVLILQYVQDYITTGFTAPGYAKYYSGVKHGITMSCVRYSTSTQYETITASNGINNSQVGTGVIVQDYDLKFTDEYNPTNHYAAYPTTPRNNIARQGSILGAHSLSGVSFGLLSVSSTIRDDWFSIPNGSSDKWGRFYGNAQTGVSFISGSYTGPSDLNELQNNAWLQQVATYNGSWIKGHYMSSVPVGYYGTPLKSGIPSGATSNFSGASFPNSSLSGKTAEFKWIFYTDNNEYTGWYSATGAANTFLNDPHKYGPHYHEHVMVNGVCGAGASASWGTVNTNMITVTLIPTVFRRFGNILRIGSGGLRNISNIFFDGRGMPSHWKLIGTAQEGYSNKCAIYCSGGDLGFSVANEPDGFVDGLLYSVGVKDFHVGFYADSGANVLLGTLVASNCSYGVVANKGSVVKTIGSVCTGMAESGFASINTSTMVAERCFTSFVGQSLVRIRLIEAGSTLSFNSFVPGQTFDTPDGRIKGTVWDWDPRDKNLTIAVKAGTLEGSNALQQ